MSDSPRRSRALSDEQLQERFDTDGLDFEAALARVLAGGPDDGDHTDDAEREAKK